MLGRQQVFLELEETECEDVEDIADIMSNVHLNNNFLALAREVRKNNGSIHSWHQLRWFDDSNVVFLFDVLCSLSA